jgi:hypothetical protein
MSYNNPTILNIQAPVGIDTVIESIKDALGDNLLWLDKSFGRAWEFKETLPDGRVIKVPKVYIGEKEYINVLPNDFLVAQSFITVDGPESWNEFNRYEGSLKQRKLSIIFWVNLKEINPSKDYIFTEELKAEIESILKLHPSILSLDEYYDERTEDIFQGFSIGEETQYLMYPYSGMRFNLTVSYTEDCNGSNQISFVYPSKNTNDIEFEIGSTGYEIAGNTTYQNDELKGFRIRLFRGSEKQSKILLPSGYSYSQSLEDIISGQFHVTPEFSDGEIITIEKY